MVEYIRRPIITTTILLCLSAFALPDNLHHVAGKCLGKTCEYCKYCKEGGGTCGVCKRKKP